MNPFQVSDEEATNAYARSLKNASTCKQCGQNLDLMTMFTEDKICGKCCRKNHRKVTKS